MAIKEFYSISSINNIKHIDNLPDSPFDDLAEFYANFLEAPYRKHLEIPTIKNQLGDLTGLTVLDFGCGPGVLSCQFKEMGG